MVVVVEGSDPLPLWSWWGSVGEKLLLLLLLAGLPWLGWPEVEVEVEREYMLCHLLQGGPTQLTGGS
jgi:hypothetical protein